MFLLILRRVPMRAVTLLAVIASAAGALSPAAAASPAQAATATASACPRPSGAVSCTPAAWTPRLPVKTSRAEQIRQIVQCGSRMYAVGSFSQIIGRNPRTGKFVTYSRNNAFSFSASRPYAVTGWNPNVNGEVNSIAVGGRDCATAYLGGTFTKVHGATRDDLAAVGTSAGALRTGFRGDANSGVETLLLNDNRLLTGGYFTRINGSSAHYYVGLSPATGSPDRYLGLNISGNYQYTGAAANPTRVYNQQLSPSGKYLLAEGDFTSVGGQPRQQIFMLSLGFRRGRVTGWTSPQFAQHCWTTEPFYVRAAAWGPTGTAIYIADTGYQPLGNTQQLRSGLCDAVARFPVTQTSVSDFWINYTGCDSLYSVAAGYGTVYIGGHERWADNYLGCDNAGSTAIPAPGLAGFVENTGAVLKGSGGRGLYERSRGLGADDELLTKAGLWIASDNQTGLTVHDKPYTSQMCGGQNGHAGLCFLPK
jgi:hypothetical protein